MKKHLMSLVTAIAIGFSLNASAQSISHIELGWITITPCSKVEWRRGALGIPSPTVKTAEQRVYALLRCDDAKLGSARATLEKCAKDAATQAIVAGLISKGAATWPVFKAKLVDCLKNEQFVGELENAVSLETDTRCMW